MLAAQWLPLEASLGASAAAAADAGGRQMRVGPLPGSAKTWYVAPEMPGTAEMYAYLCFCLRPRPPASLSPRNVAFAPSSAAPSAHRVWGIRTGSPGVCVRAVMALAERMSAEPATGGRRAEADIDASTAA